MPTLLKIDVSPRGDYSVSRKLGQTFADEWQKTHQGTIVTRDLMKTSLPFVDLPWIAGAYSSPDQHTPEQKAALKISDELIAELMAADEILITTPMYNFSIPAVLKAWIDHIVRINKTFSSSYEGLVHGKKATILIAAGSEYGPGSHMESANTETPYLKLVFGFLGIKDVNVILAGGVGAVMAGKVSMDDFIAPFQAPVLAAAK